MTENHNGRFTSYRGFFLLLLAILVLWLNWTFLSSLVMGAIFAVVLHPLMMKGKFLRRHPNIKAGLLTFGFALGFLVPIGILIFLGADAALGEIQNLQGLKLGEGEGFSLMPLLESLGLESVIAKLVEISPWSFDQLRAIVLRVLVAVGTFAGRILQNMVANIPGMVLSAVVILATVFFLLVDGKKALVFLKRNSIFNERQTARVFDVISSLCYSVVVATIAAGAVQAALIGLACLITGTHNLFLIVLTSFLASLFPMIGTAPVTLFLTASAFVRGDIFSGVVFLVFILIVGIADNIVRPYVLKGGAEVHPLIGFVAAFGALDAIGFYGLFIGPVVAGLFFYLLPMMVESEAKTRT